ncbi:protein timeless homolog [Amphibalanus amphitrite]|uniref:protein timeless homolog n=1 Tax=Amphibalanus amphitrite TaxID=1232801 RepID=UPI001C92045C|nr:protein timeless homolog [Amphibalanus amphitrite]
MGRSQPEQQQQQQQPEQTAGGEDEQQQHDVPDDEDEEDEEEEVMQEGREQEFEFKEFIQRFMSPKILEPYCWLLRHFDTNTPAANHCVLRMLHRVAWDHKMPAMLFQISLFRTFQRLMDDPRHYKNPAFKDIVKLAKYVLSKFFQMAATNKMIFMEMLFWKTPREAYELEHGYDSYKETSKATKLAWSEEEEMELQRVYEDLKEMDPDPERDLVDRILDALICRERSRRMVIKKLKQMGLVTDTRQLSGAGRGRGVRRPSPQWSEQETANLVELWHKNKDGVVPVNLIWDQLTVRRPKYMIKEKLKELGLMKSRRRRRTNPDTGGADAGRADDDDLLDTASSSSDEEDSGRPSGRSGGGGGGGGPSRRPSAPRRRRPAERRPAVRQVSAGQVAAAVRDYRQFAGEETAAEVLSWLQEALQDLEEPRREDPEEAVPLVPLSEPSAIALESETGQQLVSLLGAQKPAEGEMFWRWPSEAGTDFLLRNAAVLSDCLAGNGPAPDDEVGGSGKENVAPEEDGDRPSSEDEGPPRTASNKRIRLVSSDEDSGDEPGSAPRSAGGSSGRASPSAGGSVSQRRRLVASDSEDEPPPTGADGTPSTQRSRVGRLASDSEDDGPSQSTAARSPSQSASGRTPSTQRSRVSRVASDSEDDAPSQATSASGKSASQATSASGKSASQATSRSTRRSPSTQRSRSSRSSSSSSDSDAESSQATSRQSSSRAASSRATSPSTQRSRASRVASHSEDEVKTAGSAGGSGERGDAEGTQQKRMLSSDEEGSDVESNKRASGAKKARRVIDSDSD